MISDAHVVCCAVRVCANGVVSIRSMQVYLSLHVSCSVSFSLRRPFYFAISDRARRIRNYAGCRSCRDTCVNFLVELLSFLQFHILSIASIRMNFHERPSDGKRRRQLGKEIRDSGTMFFLPRIVELILSRLSAAKLNRVVRKNNIFIVLRLANTIALSIRNASKRILGQKIELYGLLFFAFDFIFIRTGEKSRRRRRENTNRRRK